MIENQKKLATNWPPTFTETWIRSLLLNLLKPNTVGAWQPKFDGVSSPLGKVLIQSTAVHLFTSFAQRRWISDKFVRDLLVDPATRGVKDVEHVVAAVASRTTERAAEFLKEVSAGSAVKTYGNYAQLCSDPVSGASRCLKTC